MTTEPNDKVDRTVRDVFVVDGAAVDRVANKALLATVPNWRRRLVLRAAWSLATVVVAAGLAVWLTRPVAVPPPEAAAEVGALNLSGSLVDGVLVVPIPDDGVVIVGPGERDDRPSDGYGIVLVEGELR